MACKSVLAVLPRSWLSGHFDAGAAFARSPGCFPGAAHTETAHSETLWRPRSLPAVLDGVLGAGSVLAKHQASPNWDVAGLVMDIAVSRWCRVGGAVAAEFCGGNRFAIAAKDVRRTDADQHHVCIGAVDNTLAGLATGSGVACA